MAAFRVGDEFHNHPKSVGASDAAVALWTMAGSWSARHRRDGYVSSEVLPTLRSDPEQAAAELVRRGLWRRAVGGYVFHDWADINLTRLEVLTREEQRRRRARLHRHTEVTAAVRDRDGDQCQCCLSVVRFNDRRSPNGGTYRVDDPDGPITMATVTVACRRCADARAPLAPPEFGVPHEHPRRQQGARDPPDPHRPERTP